VVDCLHGGEMAADDALRCLHHPMEGLVISSGAAAEPGSNAAREDALNGIPVRVSESFCRHPKLLESPQKVKVLFGSFSLVCLLNTPRNLKQTVETFSTSALSMCMGACLPAALPATSWSPWSSPCQRCYFVIVDDLLDEYWCTRVHVCTPR